MIFIITTAIYVHDIRIRQWEIKGKCTIKIVIVRAGPETKTETEVENRCNKKFNNKIHKHE